MWRRRWVRTAAWAGLALAVPLLARAHLERRIDRDLEPALAAALGAPVEVGAVDASLTGLVRVSEIAVTPSLTADAVELAFDPLAGPALPTEIRLVRPRVRLAAGGDPLWTRLRERLARHAAARGAAPSRIQRLVVTGGALVVDLPGGWSIRAEGVALRPRGAGVRLVAGPVDLAWRGGGRLDARARFTRAGVDLGGGGPPRLVAIGGRTSLGAGGGPRLALAGATLSSGVGGPAGEVRLTGRVDAPGGGTITAALRPEAADIDVRQLPLAFLGPLAGSVALLDAARASGRVVIDTRGGAVTAAGTLAVDRVLVTHPLVSSQPVALDGAVTARASWRRLAGRRLLAVDHARLERAGVAIDLRGLLEWAGPGALPARGDLAVSLADTDCPALLAAIPDGLRQRLAGFDVEGAAGGSLSLAFDRSDPDATALGIDLDLADCRVRGEPALADPMRLAAPFDLALEGGGQHRVGDGPDHVRLARLPRHVSGAFVAAEDARFFRHRGFDPEQIERSLAIDLDSGKLLRGGSTISQQLVKNVFLGPERTLARKLQEAVLTWRVEARLDKRLLLERYLDLIELGDGVRGVGAAARHWFARPPEKLSVRQAAFLAALTPAPRTLSRLIRASGGLAPEVAERVDIVLRAMRVAGVIDRATMEGARREPLHLAPAAVGRR
ncbi:MAG TPA: biosynthetic peptidoglycan transglycosylase [Kofleriaceae bacterium]|nr:biosynthetic peptidoglycan transglycosylase [Kofleriaceae bacterium]